VTRRARSGPPRTLEARLARDAIKSALELRGITDEIRARTVIEQWTDLVGPRIAQRTRPEGVFERTLVIEVASSAWMHELTLLKGQILSGLLARIGEPTLFDELRFKLAGRRRRDDVVPRRPVPRTAPALAAPRAPATGAAREAIVRDVERIDDAELRELVARVRIAHDR